MGIGEDIHGMNWQWVVGGTMSRSTALEVLLGESKESKLLVYYQPVKRREVRDTYEYGRTEVVLFIGRERDFEDKLAILCEQEKRA